MNDTGDVSVLEFRAVKCLSRHQNWKRAKKIRIFWSEICDDKLRTWILMQSNKICNQYIITLCNRENTCLLPRGHCHRQSHSSLHRFATFFRALFLTVQYGVVSSVLDNKNFRRISYSSVPLLAYFCILSVIAQTVRTVFFSESEKHRKLFPDPERKH